MSPTLIKHTRKAAGTAQGESGPGRGSGAYADGRVSVPALFMQMKTGSDLFVVVRSFGAPLTGE